MSVKDCNCCSNFIIISPFCQISVRVKLNFPKLKYFLLKETGDSFIESGEKKLKTDSRSYHSVPGLLHLTLFLSFSIKLYLDTPDVL